MDAVRLTRRRRRPPLLGFSGGMMYIRVCMVYVYPVDVYVRVLYG
jgi:hypothetical protein